MRQRVIASCVVVATLAGSLCAAAVTRPSPEQLRRDLAAILAQPAYQQTTPSWLRELIERLNRWLAQFFGGWLSPRVYDLGEASPVLYWVVVGLLIVLLAILLAHIGWTLGSAFEPRRRRPMVSVALPLPDPDELRARAAALAAEGRYREAVPMLYLALLRNLDRGGVLRFDPTRTNWELARLAGTSGPVRAELEGFARRLDALLYGAGVAARADYEACDEMATRAWGAGEAMGQ